jgi:hypothetical protein
LEKERTIAVALKRFRVETGEVLNLGRKAALVGKANPGSREALKKNNDGQLTAV